MLEQLFQTLQSFFDIPSLDNFFSGLKGGNIDFIGGFLSMLTGLLGGNSAN